MGILDQTPRLPPVFLHHHLLLHPPPLLDVPTRSSPPPTSHHPPILLLSPPDAHLVRCIGYQTCDQHSHLLPNHRRGEHRPLPGEAAGDYQPRHCHLRELGHEQ